MKIFSQFSRLALGALILSAAILANPRAAAAQSAGRYYVVAAHSGKCLQVSGTSQSNGAQLQQGTCSGAYGQRWRLEDLNLRLWGLLNANSNKAMEVAAPHMDDNGGRIQQWDFAPGNFEWQQWLVISTGSASQFFIVNRWTGLCLDVVGGFTNDGAAVHQWTCHGGANQRWTLVWAP